MKNVLIVGYGCVGHNLHKELSVLQPDVFDKYKTECNTKKENQKYDFAFICVDTPYIDENNVCDIKEVENAIKETNAEIFIVKSTVLPGTIERLVKETGKKIVFSPEYYGGTHHCNNFEFEFTILGGKKEVCLKVQQLLQNVYDGRHVFRIVDSKTAELAKYMENAFLATKVSFCGQFWLIANEIGVNYEELRECFVLDPRAGKSHTFVYDDKPYWQSHCLDKDVPAVAENYKARLLQSVVEFNKWLKNNF